jgi:hypothetical protein
MHVPEPSSARLPGASTNGVSWKAVSVEGKLQGFKVSRLQSSRTRRVVDLFAANPGIRNSETSKSCNLTFPLFSSMRGGVVDDVHGSCYYQTVPRVKSGLPV